MENVIRDIGADPVPLEAVDCQPGFDHFADHRLVGARLCHASFSTCSAATRAPGSRWRCCCLGMLFVHGRAHCRLVWPAQHQPALSGTLARDDSEECAVAHPAPARRARVARIAGQTVNRLRDDALEIPMFGLWLNDLIGVGLQSIASLVVMLCDQLAHHADRAGADAVCLAHRELRHPPH